MPWSVTEDGYPTHTDGSLAAWLRARDARRAARGVQLASSAQRAQNLRALLGAAATATAFVAPLPAAFVALALALSGMGGLSRYNDADGDGRPDSQYAPTPEEQVARHVAVLQINGATLPPVDWFRLLTGVYGVDMAVWWLGHALKMYGTASNPRVMLPRPHRS